MSDQSCDNCRFNGGQKCRRHAPTRGEDGFAKFPMFTDALWCGDWERYVSPQPEPIVIPPSQPFPRDAIAVYYGCQVIGPPDVPPPSTTITWYDGKKDNEGDR